MAKKIPLFESVDLTKKHKVYTYVNVWLHSMFLNCKSSLLNKKRGTLKIKRITSLPYIYAGIDVFYEQRSIEPSTMPAKGRFFDTGRKHSPSEVNEWEVAINEDFTFFQPEEKIWGITNTDFVHPCTKCNTNRVCPCTCKNGRETCPDCNGTQYTVCSFCHGSRSFLCPDCGGSGSIYEYEIDEYSISHSHSYLCDACSGRGLISCYECGGSGKQNCMKCDEYGTIVCRTCNGSRIMNCPTCEAIGYQRDYLSIKRKLDTQCYIIGIGEHPLNSEWFPTPLATNQNRVTSDEQIYHCQSQIPIYEISDPKLFGSETLSLAAATQTILRTVEALPARPLGFTYTIFRRDRYDVEYLYDNRTYHIALDPSNGAISGQFAEIDYINEIHAQYMNAVNQDNKKMVKRLQKDMEAIQQALAARASK